MSPRLGAPLRVAPVPSENRGVAVFEVSGDLVVTSMEALEETLAPALAECPLLVLDVGDLTHIDTPGLALLYRLSLRLAEAGGSLTLARFPERFAELIQELRLAGELRMRDTVRAALDDLDR